jgi:hypothetical protein
MPAATPEKKPAPRTRTAAKPAEPPQPPPLPTRLTKQQIDWLLAGIEPYRVQHKGGQSNLQSYDVRNHLNEVFGFANWDGEVIDMTCVFDVPRQLNNGKPGAYVCYRATYRLTIKALAGNVLATYTEVAAGDATMPANMRFEAHDFALKTAESQALKRAAINLGNQYGLSLYAKGNTSGITRGTFAYPEEMKLDPLTEPIHEETDPDASHEAAAAFEAAEASQAPQTPPASPQAPAPTPEPVTAQQAPPPPAQEPEPTPPPADVAEEIQGLHEAIGWLSPEARNELYARWKKDQLTPLARMTTAEEIAKAWQLYAIVKPPAAQQQPSGNPETQAHDVQEGLTPQQSDAGSIALSQQRQAQIDQARRHFPNAPQQEDTPHGYSQSWPEPDNNEFYG